jgi:hypothetical protein
MSAQRIVEYALLCTVLLAPMTPLFMKIARDLSTPDPKAESAKKVG